MYTWIRKQAITPSYRDHAISFAVGGRTVKLINIRAAIALILAAKLRYLA